METKSIDDLKADPRNPRFITKEAYAKLQKLLDKFGDLSGIILNIRTGQLVGGHMRLKHFQESGGASNVQITQRFDEATKSGTVAVGYVVVNGEMFSYREVDWDEGFQRAANIAANNAGGENDLDLLGQVIYELSQLENGDELLSLTALMDDDINKLLDQVGANGEGDPADDEAPEVDEVNPPVSKLGEIYQLGNHRLMCGDSTDFGAVSDLMNGQTASMIFTDPPYGVSYQSNMRTQTEKFDVLQNDDKLITEWIEPALQMSQGWVFIWTSWKVLEKWIDITRVIGEMTNMIIWDKGGGGIGDLQGTFASDYEVALVFNRGAKITGERLGSVWSIGKDAASVYEHPTQKPVALATTAIKNTTLRGQIVLDLFSGSGSTLIACEQYDRIFYGMELDPRYADVIRKRYAKHTNQEDWIAATPVIQSAEEAAAPVANDIVAPVA